MSKKIIYYGCPCAIGKHKVDTSTKLGKYIHAVIIEKGETIRVTTDGKKYHDVPRIYLAIHGLKGKEVKTFPLSRQQ